MLWTPYGHHGIELDYRGSELGKFMFTEINHYVPQWYQKRFIPSHGGEQKFHYLDLTPPRVMHSDGSFHRRNELRRLGPANCFAQPNLYTLFFGKDAADIIERHFFGVIDRLGADAVKFFSNYALCGETGAAFNNLLRYLDAQKLRTPKGLDLIKRLPGRNSHQDALKFMGQLWQAHMTIWTEGVWEIVQCDQSETKFIISDHPVTTYNKNLFPLSPECKYPFDAPIECLATHTIFPLDLNRCLVITNLGYVRNPEANPLQVRENPRYFAPTVFDIRKVQTGRQISEDNVRAINYIAKRRARRYVAAAQKEWLYPEKILKTTMWDKLGDRFFLMPDPRKVSFSTDFFAGYKDGSVWGSDEYGRRPRKDDPVIETQRAIEWSAFQRSKKEWDERFGKLPIEELERYW